MIVKHTQPLQTTHNRPYPNFDRAPALVEPAVVYIHFLPPYKATEMAELYESAEDATNRAFNISIDHLVNAIRLTDAGESSGTEASSGAGQSSSSSLSIDALLRRLEEVLRTREEHMST